jgi:hypothetical protein
LAPESESSGKVSGITEAQFNLEIENINVEYEPSNSVVSYTMNTVLTSVEAVTKIYNILFHDVDDSWVPDNKSGWEKLEIGLEIYAKVRTIVLEYAVHQNEIIGLLNEMKEKLYHSNLEISDLLNLKDDFEFLEEDDLQEEELQEKLSLTKLRVIEYYGLLKIYNYVHSLSISKTQKFQEMEKMYDGVLIDYINELNKVIFIIHFMLAQDAIFTQRTKAIRDSNNPNSSEFYLKYMDYLVEVTENVINYKDDIRKFYRQSLHSFKTVLMKGERISQILTDQILLMRTTGFNTLIKK